MTGLWVAYVQGPIALSRGCAVVCVCMCLGSVRQTELAELMNSIAFMDEQSRTNRAPLLKASSFPPQVHSATTQQNCWNQTWHAWVWSSYLDKAQQHQKASKIVLWVVFVSLGYCIWEVFDCSLIWDQFTFVSLHFIPYFSYYSPFFCTLTNQLFILRMGVKP